MNKFGYVVLSLFLLTPFSNVFAVDGSLYISPKYNSYVLGETFELALFANTDGVLVNAAEAELSFNPNLLQVAVVSTAGSKLDLWSTEPTYSNESGTIRFSGWANRAFSGDANLLLKISFRALSPGIHSVDITSGSLLSSDGRGSNVITGFGSGSYTVSPRSVAPDATDNGAGLVLGASTQSIDAPPAKPIITSYPTKAQEGDQFIVRGSASPDSKVLIWVQKRGGDLIKESTTSFPDGTFVLVSNKRLEAGNYKFWAEVYNKNNVLGPPSEPVAFEVVQTGYQSLASTALVIATTPPSTNIIILVLGFILGYLFLRFLIEKRLI